MAHVVYRAHAVLWAEAAIEYGQMLGLEAGRAFDGSGGINVSDDLFHLLRTVTQLDERLRHGVVDDLDHAAAHQLLVFHQSQIRLNTCGIAIHHERSEEHTSELQS